ncbi:MAG: FAD-binding oxidoreductase [Thermodesulfobacteriota bacterium]
MNGTPIIEKAAAALKAGAVMTDPAGLAVLRPDNPLIDGCVPPVGVVRPENAGELGKLLACANENAMNLCVVSSAGSHYHGTFASDREHLLVDLSSWQGIPWINRRNRVCLIEPGVTYGQLLAALDPEGLTVSMPLAPPAGKSVLAACLDREPSTWPNKQWDIGDPVASTEFYFGGGQRFRTGAAGGPGSLEAQRAAGGAQKCPTGPSQTDFHRVIQGAQGTMGIVTWMTIRAEIKPTIQKPFLLVDDNPGRLVSFVYAAQRPGLGEHSFIVNRICAAMLINAARRGKKPCPAESLPEYICLQNIAGFEVLPKERVAYQVEDIREKSRQAGLKMKRSLRRISADEFLGIATRPCGDSDWRRQPTGDYLSVFFLTTLDRTEELIGVFESIAGSCGFGRDAVGIYIQPVTQNHACHMEFIVPYDRQRDIDAARKLEQESTAALMENGAFFSRPYLSAGNRVLCRNPQNLTVLKKIKDIFDPNRVLNRGKWGL